MLPLVGLNDMAAAVRWQPLLCVWATHVCSGVIRPTARGQGFLGVVSSSCGATRFLGHAQVEGRGSGREEEGGRRRRRRRGGEGKEEREREREGEGGERGEGGGGRGLRRRTLKSAFLSAFFGLVGLGIPG